MLPLLRLSFLVSWCLSVAPGAELYEFRGQVVQDDGRPFRRVTPLVFLQGATSPFSARAVADSGGRFTFKRLLPGMYTLYIAVPHAGTLRRTVEVGASFADPKGRIEASFVVERKPSAAESSIISASQLSVPEKATLEYEKAQERLGKRDVAGAIQFLKNAVEIAPRYSAAWNNLGTIAYQSRRFAEAEEYFRSALKADPDSYAPLVNLGGALLSLGKIAESLPVNERAVKARPDDALAHSQLGQSYMLAGQIEEAEVHLKAAKALDPGHFSFPQMVLAQIYLRRGDHAAAARELEEFLRYHPDSALASGVSRTLDELRTGGKEHAKP